MFSSIDELCRSVPKFSRMSVYTYPNIPHKKLINAIQGYGEDWVKPSDILVLVDDTVFGSAKDGFFLTKTHFFGNKIFGFIDNNIGDVYYYDKEIYIEDKSDDTAWIVDLDIGSSKDKPALVEYLNKCMKTLIYIGEQEKGLEQAKLEKEHEQHQKRQQELAVLEQERQQQLAIQNAKIERQQKINAIFEDTSDEILSRVNNLFKIISEIDKQFLGLVAFNGFIKERMIPSELFDDENTQKYGASFYTILGADSIITGYKRLVSEYNKMRAISEIIEKNKDIIIERLNIASEYIDSYQKLEEFACHCLSEILVDFDKSLLVNEDNTEFLLSMDKKEEIIQAEKDIFVYPSPPKKKDIDNIHQVDDIDDSSNIEEQNTALSNFFMNNSDSIISRLKTSGLQLSASALQNDENISRVAGVIHNLLPAAIRFFVSYNTVENFLLNNRQWLINKLT